MSSFCRWIWCLMDQCYALGSIAACALCAVVPDAQRSTEGWPDVPVLEDSGRGPVAMETEV